MELCAFYDDLFLLILTAEAEGSGGKVFPRLRNIPYKKREDRKWQLKSGLSTPRK